MAYEWSALDPSQELFMHFASWMFLVGYPYGTIRTYVASIPSLYICIGIELSLAKTTYPALARCLKGIRRICPSVPTGKSEITLAILFAIRKITNLLSLKSWPSGPRSVWVSSPSFDLETWFQNLKMLGNQESALHAAMFILLSGVQSFVSVSPKLTNSKALHWKSLSLSSLAPPYVPLLPSEHSWKLLMPSPVSPCFPGLGGHGSHTQTTSNTSSLRSRNLGWIQNSMVVTAPEEEVLPKLQELVLLDTTSNSKECGRPMPILDIYPYQRKTDGKPPSCSRMPPKWAP